MKTFRSWAAVSALVAFSLIGAVVIGAVRAAPAVIYYSGRVLKVIDGDTVHMWVDDWAATPFASIRVRVYGIDSPETTMPPGKCAEEVEKGRDAKTFAQTVLKPGDQLRVRYYHPDKYAGRINADLILADGRSFAAIMLTNGHAQEYAYNQGARKPRWCD